MPHDRQGDERAKGQKEDQAQGKFRGEDRKGAKIQGRTAPKGTGSVGGHPVDKERLRDTLNSDKQSYNKEANNDV